MNIDVRTLRSLRLYLHGQAQNAEIVHEVLMELIEHLIMAQGEDIDGPAD